MFNARSAGLGWKACLQLRGGQILHKGATTADSLALISAYHTSACLFNRALGDPENKGGHQTGVNFDTLGSWNNRMELPLHLEHSIKFGKLIPKLSYKHIAYASVTGRRKDNEDRCKIADLDKNLILFSIFDGHGGALAADVVSEHVADHVKFWLKKETDLRVVLKHTFLDLNNLFSMHLHHNCPDKEKYMRSGTTAVVCLLRNSIELVIAHVGDSEAIMCRQGRVLRLTENHLPTVEREKERIKSCGGVLTSSSIGSVRVNGRLEMTRSIGDLELKQYGVIAEPDIRSIEVKHGKDAFLVLITDGVSSVLNDQELISIISSKSSPPEAAHSITDQALQFGSDDNCSAVIVPFGSWGKYATSQGAVNYSFGRNMIGRRYN